MSVLTLRPRDLAQIALPLSTTWLLGACMEGKGKQDLWTRQKPEVLSALRHQAVIQSVESSNRIEGITVAAQRLRPVVFGKSRPKDRPEEELAGYRHALAWIYTRKGKIEIDPDLVRRLHRIAQSGAGDAGEWKQRNNEIIEFLPNGTRKVRFVPASAKDTPRLLRDLCRNYRQGCEEERIPPLLLAATFVFDFLCIHPFRDGNGRVSRLLTTLLLQSHGFDVGRYISLERLVEESKEDYYRILAECSQGWHEGRNEIVPWWNYQLGILRRAYKEWDVQVTAASARSAKTGLVRGLILDQHGEFTLADLSAQLPGASPQLIKKVLAELKAARKVRLTGRGRGARWIAV